MKPIAMLMAMISEQHNANADRDDGTDNSGDDSNNDYACKMADNYRLQIRQDKCSACVAQENAVVR